MCTRKNCFSFLIKIISNLVYIIGLSRLLIGKSTIEDRGCTMSGIGYPKKLA